MSEAGLKCCPFCGGTDIGYGDRLSYDDLPEFFVFCRECGTKGPSLEDEESAHGNWNKRAVEDELVAALEEYQAANNIGNDEKSKLWNLGKAALSKARGEVTR